MEVDSSEVLAKKLPYVLGLQECFSVLDLVNLLHLLQGLDVVFSDFGDLVNLGLRALPEELVVRGQLHHEFGLRLVKRKVQIPVQHEGVQEFGDQ